MLVFLDCIADVERLSRFYHIEMLRHIECYTVDYISRLFVDHFELNMFQFLPYKFAGPIVTDRKRTEHRFRVAGTEGVELLQQ